MDTESHLDIQKKKAHKGLLLMGGTLFLYLILSFFFFRPPAGFSGGQTFSVAQGATGRTIVENLEQQDIIRSARAAEVYTQIAHQDGAFQAGDYVFEQPLPMMQIIDRLHQGDYGDSQMTVTIFEGLTGEKIADILEKQNFTDFDSEMFIKKADAEIGKVFPDTYSFFPSADTQTIFDTMRQNFDTQIESLLIEIEKSPHTLEDIITMASIIQREAFGEADRRLISGVLWRRIEKGIPLQVDATLTYLLGKTSSQLTQSDLKYDSPYNTYQNRGLPPGPISNPGLAAIEAALYPEDSPYLYFLHDSSGAAHFAETFEGHKANKRRYLR